MGGNSFRKRARGKTWRFDSSAIRPGEGPAGRGTAPLRPQAAIAARGFESHSLRLRFPLAESGHARLRFLPMPDGTPTSVPPSTSPKVSAPPPIPASEQSAPAASAPSTYSDDQFSREQIVRHARTLLGTEGFIAEVAIRHAGGADFFTVEDAKTAVQALLSAPAGGS